ncbi:MAG TPA: Rieske 2Fe-2S domain-containing protein [Chloroflexota bacterium]|jgi:5,5'-dehydrodivanillate O-demethylase
MLTKEENERLTRVGPGTPMGELLRRYWYPVASVAELQKRPTKFVRLLGESLVLYRDRQGRYGLLGARCPHRRVSLVYGIPEDDGLRCAYHGWYFNGQGQCIDQPGEPWDSTFKDKVQTVAYPAQELGGMVFAYLGPEPAPLLPRYDLFAWDNTLRQIGATVVPCNWLQIMENSLDPLHAEWLHRRYMQYILDLQGEDTTRLQGRIRPHAKMGFDVFEHGIIKRRVIEGQTEDHDNWVYGHPVVFPNMLRAGAIGTAAFQIRVPMDDTHTWHVWYETYRPGGPVPPQEMVPYYEVPWQDAAGEFITDYVDGQDIMCWVTQGDVAERDLERLGVSDTGIILFRQLLQEQMARVEAGEDPMEVYRDPAANQLIAVPQERDHDGTTAATTMDPRRQRTSRVRFSPYFPELQAQFLALHEQAVASGQVDDGAAPPVPPTTGWGHREVQILPPDGDAGNGHAAAGNGANAPGPASNGHEEPTTARAAEPTAAPARGPGTPSSR